MIMALGSYFHLSDHESFKLRSSSLCGTGFAKTEKLLVETSVAPHLGAFILATTNRTQV
jgi:hypothetical protein